MYGAMYFIIFKQGKLPQHRENLINVKMDVIYIYLKKSLRDEILTFADLKSEHDLKNKLTII